jgi:hypothetical protein
MQKDLLPGISIVRMLNPCRLINACSVIPLSHSYSYQPEPDMHMWIAENATCRYTVTFPVKQTTKTSCQNVPDATSTHTVMNWWIAAGVTRKPTLHYSFRQVVICVKGAMCVTNNSPKI